MRIDPKLIPHLVSKDAKADVPHGMKRGLIPSQKNISVQDVKDYSTPQGAAMANEEMRKLRMAINSLSDKENVVGSQESNLPATVRQPVAQLQPTTTPDGNEGNNGTTTIAKLYTIYHNGIVIKTLERNQSLNFLDNGADTSNMKGVVFTVNASGDGSYENATVSAFAPTDPWYIERFTLDVLDTEAVQSMLDGGSKYRTPMYHDVVHGLNNPVYSIYSIGDVYVIPEIELYPGRLRVRSRLCSMYKFGKPFLNTEWHPSMGPGELLGKEDVAEFIIIVRGVI